MLTGFLQQYGLPGALHSLSAGADIPEEVWHKVAEY